MTKQLADAQATIAALQAQLATCFKLSGADPDGNEDWRLAPHAVEEVTRLRNDYDELGDETEALRDHLTQRTAELEAAKQHQQLHDRIFARQRDLMAHYVATIRAAIRSLGNSTHSKERPEPYESRTPVIAAFLGQALGVTAEEAERERVNLQAELERVRALVKALPKVEGEIVVHGRTIDEQYPTLSWQIASTGMDEFTNAIAALLQHRQGMEG